MEIVLIVVSILVLAGLFFTKPGQALLAAVGIKVGNYADNLNTRSEKIKAEADKELEKSKKELEHNQQLVDKTGTSAADLTGKADLAQKKLGEAEGKLKRAVATVKMTKGRANLADQSIKDLPEGQAPTPEQSKELKSAQAAHHAALEDVLALKRTVDTLQATVNSFTQAAQSTSQAAEEAAAKVKEAQDKLSTAQGAAEGAVAKEQAAEAIHNVDQLSDGGVQHTVDRLQEMDAQANAQLNRSRGSEGEQELAKMKREQELKDLEKDLGI